MALPNLSDEDRQAALKKAAEARRREPSSAPRSRMAT